MRRYERLFHGKNGGRTIAGCSKAGISQTWLWKSVAAENLHCGRRYGWAVYFLFKNKQELFARIVDKMVQQIAEFCKGMILSELEDWKTGIENDGLMMKFLYGRREEFRLLLEKSKGRKYAGFKKFFIKGE